MSHLRKLRGALLALGVLAAGAVAPSASASPYYFPFSNEATYTCAVPDLGDQQTEMAFESMVWEAVPTGQRWYGDAEFTATISQFANLLRLRGATTLAVSGTWQWQTSRPDGTEPLEDVSFDLGNRPVGAGPDLTVGGPIASPTAIQTQGGWYRYSLNQLAFVIRGTNAAGESVNLGATGDADGDISTANVACTGEPAQVGEVRVIPSNAPDKPVIDRVDTTATSATVVLRPNARYVETNSIYDADTYRVIASAPGNASSITVTGLDPGKTYTWTVGAYALWESSVRSDPVTFTTQTLVRPIKLSGSGKLTVRGSFVGSAPVTASVNGDLDVGTGTFTGATNLGLATANLTAYGFIPVRAVLAFKPVGGTAIRDLGPAFALDTTQDISIKSATFVGIRLATGTCHTAVPPAITLTGGVGGSPEAGGTLAGTFSLGRLTGCSAFGTIAGTNGGAGTLSVKLAPAVPAPGPA